MDGGIVIVAKKETYYREEEEEAVIDSVPREGWIPDLSGDLQSAIAAADSAIERSVDEPSDYGLATSVSVSSLEEYTEDWPSYSAGMGYADEEPLVFTRPEDLETLDGMDLDEPTKVQHVYRESRR